MLSPNLTLTIKFLKSLTRMLVPKQLNPKRRHRGGRGNPISSSFPRHNVRIKDQEHTAKREKETKTKPRANCKLAQKNIEQEELYDA